MPATKRSTQTNHPPFFRRCEPNFDASFRQFANGVAGWSEEYKSFGFRQIVMNCNGRERKFDLGVVRDLPSHADHILDLDREKILDFLPDLREMLGQALNPTQANIEKKIQYTISTKGEVNAFAAINEQGIGVISLDAGLARFAVWAVSLAEVIRKDTQLDSDTKNNCSEAYQSFLADGANEGLLARNSLRNAYYYRGLYAFIPNHPEMCPRLTREEIHDLADSENTTAAVNSFLLFVIGHELAHHLQGDLKFPARSGEEQRAQERTADEFAFKLLSRIHPATVAALDVTYPLMCLINDFDWDTEFQFDHPAGIRRLNSLVRAMEHVTFDPEFQRVLNDAKLSNQWSAEIKNLRNALREQHAEE